jgi:hypothetical protein
MKVPTHFPNGQINNMAIEMSNLLMEGKFALKHFSTI